jgi:hypothetical protein
MTSVTASRGVGLARPRASLRRSAENLQINNHGGMPRRVVYRVGGTKPSFKPYIRGSHPRVCGHYYLKRARAR